MGDIFNLKDSIENAIQRAESASWDAEQAVDNAGDARDGMQNVESILNDILSDIESTIGFDKDKLDIAIANTETIVRLLKFYLQRIEECASKTVEYDPRYSMLISAINLVTTGYQELGWDEGYTIENDYVNGEYCVVFKKVAKKEESNG